MGAQHRREESAQGPYDVTKYQTTHLCGGAIMGTDPKTSAVNRYLQSWDVPNLFVMGASAFPQNAGYNPTGTVGGARLLVGGRDPRQYLKNPGPLVACVRPAALARRRRGGLALLAVYRSSAARRATATSRISRRSSAAAIWRRSPTAPPATPHPDGKPVRRRPADRDAVRHIVVAPNITPDRETGIGGWSDAEFDDAVRQRHPPRRRAALSGDAVPVLHQDVARRRAWRSAPISTR